ncbi:MAG TPA: tetratricopeptide repeat protein [Spirochaetota bacterium]|nr:tetratricopeptide repeat protein [Spirochaetota bacterium]HPS85388.1 tetratricopeptide repeat protein [Spirochaetota bacterium]
MKNRKFIIINLILTLIIISTDSFSVTESRFIFNQGLEAFKAGNYASAELLFRKTEENNDEFRDRAWFFLARTIYQQAKYKSAIFEFNSFLTKCRTENLRVESRFWIGESYFNLNENLKAIEEYNRFLEKADDINLIITAHDRIATIYYNQQRYEESIIEWENAIRTSSDKEQNASLVLKIGHALFKNDKYENALERLNPLLSARIDSKKKGEIRLIIGRIYQLQNDHKKALNTFNAIPAELAETYPLYDMYYFRALSYLETDKANQAKSDFDLFSIIGKKSDFYYDGLYEYGRILLKSSKPESGIEILDKVWESQEKLDLAVKSALLLADYYIENDPKKSIRYLEKFNSYDDEELKKTIIITISKAYIKNENYDKAENILAVYLEKYPYDQNIDEVKFLQARILLEKGDVDNATLIFNDLKKNNPFSKFLNDSDYYLALVSYKKGKINESISLLKKYVSFKDINYSFEAHRQLTELYLETDDIKNTEKEINLLISTFPNYSGVDRLVYRLALALIEKNNASSAKYFNILQYRYPDSNYSVMINILNGNKYFENKNYSKAIIYYEKFLNSNIEESRGTAYYNLLKSYFYLKEYNKVIGIIKNIKIPPLDENQWREIPFIHARSLYMLSKYDEVFNILKWEDIKTFTDEDAKMLINSTIKTGDIETATKFIDKLKDREGLHNEQLLILGNFYQARKNYSKAEDVYNTILTSNASEVIKESVRIELALMKMETGEFDLSLNYLNQVEFNDNVPERDSLIIMNHFYIGKEKTAADITDSRINYILKTRFTEKVLLLNLTYHFKNKQVNSFTKYAALLKSYRNNENYVDYLSGMLFYQTGDFKKSYNYFYKLSLKDNEYITEINYYLGRLSLLYNRNKNSAIKYFLKVVELNNKNDYVYKSKIELAIIYYEMKNTEYAFNYLNEIITDSTHSKYKLEAENLLEYFNLLKNSNGGDNL